MSSINKLASVVGLCLVAAALLAGCQSKAQALSPGKDGYYPGPKKRMEKGGTELAPAGGTTNPQPGTGGIRPVQKGGGDG